MTEGQNRHFIINILFAVESQDIEGHFVVPLIFDRSADAAFANLKHVADTTEQLEMRTGGPREVSTGRTHETDIPGIDEFQNWFGIETSDSVFPQDRQAVQLSLDADSLAGGDTYLEDALELIETLVEHLDPLYVYGMHVGHIELVGVDRTEPVTAESLADDRINSPTWLMLFPPAMVETYGREWLLDLPVPYAEELDDGAILILTMTDFGKFEYDVDMLEALWEARESLEETFEARHAEL